MGRDLPRGRQSDQAPRPPISRCDRSGISARPRASRSASAAAGAATRARVDGILVSEFEQDEIGPDLFRHACMIGLEGLVSKHHKRLYRGGRSPHWIKVKNRTPSLDRPRDGGVFLIASKLIRPNSASLFTGNSAYRDECQTALSKDRLPHETRYKDQCAQDQCDINEVHSRAMPEL